jgi:hypothetical protein
VPGNRLSILDSNGIQVDKGWSRNLLAEDSEGLYYLVDNNWD